VCAKLTQDDKAIMLFMLASSLILIVVGQIVVADCRAERALSALDEARTRADMCRKVIEQCCR